MHRFYVYILIDPFSEKPFYIGKGQGSRMYEHAKLAHRGKTPHNNKSLYKIIRNIQNNNLKVIYNKVLVTPDEQEAFRKEVELIEHYGRRDLGTGCLVNLTSGGDGIPSLSQHTRTKMSNSQKRLWRDPKHRKRMSNVHKEHKQSPETSEKRSISMKEAWKYRDRTVSIEQRAKISVSLRGERNVNSKLKELDIPIIRRLCIDTKLSQASIAKMFGVAESTMNAVLTGRTWKHI